MIFDLFSKRTRGGRGRVPLLTKKKKKKRKVPVGAKMGGGMQKVEGLGQSIG